MELLQVIIGIMVQFRCLKKIDRYFIYTFGNESWYIDGYELETHITRNSTPVSNMHRRHFDTMYCGLKIRMDCHEFIEDKLRNVRR